MKLSRQAEVVRAHLSSAPHLTSWQAEGVYRIRRLASRISELKNAGFDIEKATMKDATGQTYTRYGFTRAQRRKQAPINTPLPSQKRYTIGDIAALYEAYCRDSLDLSANETEGEVLDFTGFVKAAE